MKSSLTLCLLIVSLTLANTGRISNEVIRPTNYNTFNPPREISSQFTDPAFGTEITRITNSAPFLNTGRSVLGGYFANSEICYFNYDGSFFLAAANEMVDGVFRIVLNLYNGLTGEKIKRLGIYGDLFRPYFIRWTLEDYYTKNGQKHAFDPRFHFYQYYQNEIRLYDVRDIDNYIVLRQFDEYTTIGAGGGEGDISDDGRFWVLDGDGEELFVYDLLNDVKYTPSTFELGSLGSKGSLVGVDYASISSGGDYVIISWGTEPGVDKRYAGIELYDRNFNFIRQLHPGIVHWEAGIDVFGEDVVYTIASFDAPGFFSPYDVTAGDIISIRLRDGFIRLLADVPNWAHMMFSGCNSVTDGRYVYATYMTRSTDPTQYWSLYWDEIIEVPTDGSQLVRRFAHTRSHEVDGFSTKYYQPDIVINRQGTRIVFRSTYNTGVGDLYMFAVSPRAQDEMDTILPLTPHNIRAGERTHNTIELLWDVPEAAADGDTALYYEVHRDGDYLRDAFTTSLVDSGFAEAEFHTYEVYSVDDVGNRSETAASIELSTVVDRIGPKIKKLRVERRDRVVLYFSEALNSASATNPDHYYINQGVTINSASLADDKKTVFLETSTLPLGVDFTLTINHVKDQSTQLNEIELNTTLHFNLLDWLFDDFNVIADTTWQFRTPENWGQVYDGGSMALAITTSNYRTDTQKTLGEWALLQNSDEIGRAFIIRTEVKSTEDLSLNPHADYVIVFGFQDENNHAYVQFQRDEIKLHRIVNGERVEYQSVPYQIDMNDYQLIEVMVRGKHVNIFIENKPVCDYFFQEYLTGKFGLGSYNDAAVFNHVNIGALVADLEPPAPPTGLQLQNP